MSIFKNFLLFGIGAGLGFGAGWLFSKRKYEKIADEEIDEVKRYYLQKDMERQDKLDLIQKQSDKLSCAMEEAKICAAGTPGIISANWPKGSDEKVKAEAESPEEDEPTKPYLISEEEFLDDKNEYEKLSLTYFAMDDTLADDCDEMVDIEETISSDIYNQIAEGDDSDYYVRNNELQCDYEIMKVDGSYKERYGFPY